MYADDPILDQQNATNDNPPKNSVVMLKPGKLYTTKHNSLPVSVTISGDEVLPENITAETDDVTMHNRMSGTSYYELI